MKIKTSYFYQIRNFKENMIPVSTAIYDPKWYHDNRGHSYIYEDKRGIINGIRLEALITQAQGCGLCPCEDKNPNTCAFLKSYQEQLEKINFNKMINDIKNFANHYQQYKGFKEEPIIVLIVYETPQNKCSERIALQNYFKSHGFDCQELEYPIHNLEPIKNEPFEF